MVKEDLYNQVKKSRRQDKILTWVISLVIILAALIFILSFMFYMNSSEYKLKLGAEISKAVISNDSKSVYISLKGGINQGSISKIKFNFKDAEGKDHLYVTEQGAKEMSVPYKNGFFSWFKGDQFNNEQEYNINAADLKLLNFSNILSVDVFFEYLKPSFVGESSLLDSNSLDLADLRYGRSFVGKPKQFCNPKTCSGLGKQCGNWNDGCGTILGCGSCNPGYTCNSSGGCILKPVSCINDTGCSVVGSFCEGNLTYTCSAGSDGCLDRVNGNVCGNGFVCNLGNCLAIGSCYDKIQDGSEQGIDCGGSCNNICYNVITRWDVVPYQEFNSTFNIGIVAFHTEGINRIYFEASDGIHKKNFTVTQMTLNSQTDVKEYWIPLNPADFNDGMVEIKAIVYPNVGNLAYLIGECNQSTALIGYHSMFLWNNFRNTLENPVFYCSPNGIDDVSRSGNKTQPFRQPGFALGRMWYLSGQKSLRGGIIYLEEGDYEYKWQHAGTTWLPDEWNETDLWVTITPVSGAKRENVRFTTSGNDYYGMSVAWVKLEGVTLAPVDENQSWQCGHFGNARGGVWFDNCVFTGPGDSIANSPFSNVDWARFWTNCYSENSMYGFHGSTNVASLSMCRNCSTERIGSDHYKFVQVIINSKAGNLTWPEEHRAEPGAWHPDVWQAYGGEDDPITNYMIYGLNALSYNMGQGIGPSNAKDLAIVNVYVDNRAEGANNMQNLQIGGVVQTNVYIKDSVFFHSSNNIRTGVVANNFVIENTKFPNQTDCKPSIWSGVTGNITFRNVPTDCTFTVNFSSLKPVSFFEELINAIKSFFS
jgi:hypothetical protein